MVPTAKLSGSDFHAKVMQIDPFLGAGTRTARGHD